MVLKDYNYIIAGTFIIVVDNIVRGKLMQELYVLYTGLSEQEVQLFYETMHVCIKTIDPLVYKYTWAQTEHVNKYLPQCYQQLESVKSYLSNVD